MGSEMSDIRQERSIALKKYLSGNKDARKEVMTATEKYEKALMPKAIDNERFGCYTRKSRAF